MLSSWTQADERWAWEGHCCRDLSVLIAGRRLAHSQRRGPLELVSCSRGLRPRPHFGVEHDDITFADEAEWWEWKWSFSVRGVLEQLDDATRDAFRKAAFAAMQPLREESASR